MKKILTALSVIVVFASCQKEISFGTDNPGNTGGAGGSGGTGGGGSTSGLLVKTVAITGTETITTLYTYDSQKRLETITTAGTSGGLPAGDYVKYIRDAAGRIIKKLQKHADFAGATTDTAVQIFHYPDATSLEYNYSVNSFNTDMGGGILMSSTDSCIYTYSAGKMTSFSEFLLTSAFGFPLPPTESRTDFGYDASDRVTTMKVYNDQVGAGGSLGLFADYTYTYASTSVNNLYYTTSGAQNFALNGLPNTGAQVISKMHTVSNATSPAVDMTLTTTFVNGAGNKPASATATAVTTGQPTQTTNYTFFYQ